MTTLKIASPKKNLGRWLAAAARGEDSGVVFGADIVALRKVSVESTDYAQREYGALPEQVVALERAIEKRYRSLRWGKTFPDDDSTIQESFGVSCRPPIL